MGNEQSKPVTEDGKVEGPLFTVSGFAPYAGRAEVRRPKYTKARAPSRANLASAPRVSQKKEAELDNVMEEIKRLEEEHEEEVRRLQTALEDEKSRATILQALADTLGEREEEKQLKIDVLTQKLDERGVGEERALARQNEQLQKEVEAMRERLRGLMARRGGEGGGGGDENFTLTPSGRPRRVSILSTSSRLGPEKQRRHRASLVQTSSTPSSRPRAAQSVLKPRRRLDESLVAEVRAEVQEAREEGRSQPIRNRSITSVGANQQGQSAPALSPEKSAEVAKENQNLREQAKVLRGKLTKITVAADASVAQAQEVEENLSHTQNELVSAKAEVSELKVSLSRAKEEGSVNKVHNAKLLEELGSLQGEYEGVLKDIGTLKEASEAKQKEYSEKIATLKEAEEELSSLRGEFEEVKSEREALEAEKDSLLSTKEKIEGKYQKEAEKTAKLKEANQELLESQKQLQEQNNSVGLEKEQALLQAESLASEVERLERDTKRLNSEEERLKEKLSSLQTEKTALETEKTALLEQNQEGKKEKGELEERVKEEVRAKDRFKEEAEGLENELKKEKEEGERLGGKLGEIQGRVEELLKEVKKLESEKGEKVGEVGRLEAEREGLRGEVDKEKERVKEIRKGLEEKEGEVRKLDGELEQEREKLRKEEERREEEGREGKRKEDALGEDNERLKAQIEELRAQYASLSQEGTEKEQSLGQAFEHQTKKHEEEIKKLQERHEKEKEERDREREEGVDKREKAIAILEKKLEGIKQKSQERENSHGQQLEQFEQEKQSLANQIAALEEGGRKGEREREDLAKELEEEKKEKGSLGEKVVLLEGEKEREQEEKAKLQKELETVQKQKGVTLSDLAESQSTIATLNDSIQQLNQQNQETKAKHEEEMKKEEERAQEKEDEMQLLRQELAAAQKKAQAAALLAARELAELKSKNDELERQNKKQEGEIESLSAANLDTVGESDEKSKQLEKLQTEVAASFALLQAEKEKAQEDKEESQTIRKALEARIVELEKEISRLSGEISDKDEEKRRREEMEREKRRIRAEMARKAMEKELQEVHGLLVGQEGVLEGVGGDRNKLWRQLQMLMADIHKTGEEIAKDDEEMQTWQLRKLEQTARERTDFSSSLASFEKSLKGVNGGVDKLHYLRESLQTWKDELENRRKTLKQEIEEAAKTRDPSLQKKRDELALVEESLSSRSSLDNSQTWKTLLVLFEQGKNLLEEGKESVSRMVTVDALQSVEELEQEIQRTSDELKEQLEDVEYSMIEIDDILAELKGVHGSRAFFKTTTKEFKESLDELGDPDSEKRGVLGQKIQYLRDEIKRNDGLKKEVEGKIREEKSGLALLLERIQMLQEVSKKRGDLISELDMEAECAREEDLVEKTHDMEDCIEKLKTLVERELETAEKLDEKRREGQSQSRYVAQQGDEVDKMVSDMIAKIFASNEAIVPSNFQRLEEGVYQFGTRKIHATILAGSLVVRVGGGYMKFIEFVKKYGKFESIKIIKAQGAASQAPSTMVKSGGSWKVLGAGQSS